MQTLLLGVLIDSGILLSLAYGLSIAGFHLLRSGWRVRSANRAPHCSLCHYELTDTTINKCPRCGVEPALDTTQSPPRSSWRFVTGTLCLIGGLFLLTRFPLWVFALLAGLQIVNLLFSRLFDGGKATGRLPESSTQEFVSSKTFDEFLSNHGNRVPGFEMLPEHLPLHSSFLELFNTYDQVTVREWPCYERRLLAAPYEFNPAFLQFGEDPTGSPILLRRCSEDPIVYVSDCDECMPEQVIPYAASLQAYLFAMHNEMEESEAALEDLAE